jgi:hypothetical protein
MTPTLDCALARAVAARDAGPIDAVAADLRLADRTIRRVAADPFFLGHTLAICKARFGVDDETLARFLACSPAGLTRLALCSRPYPGSARYGADVNRVARISGADPMSLATLIELADPQ